MPSYFSDLNRLARQYGIQTAYYDVKQRRHQTSPESLLAGLRLLGADIDSFEDAPHALQKKRIRDWSQGLEPVIVVWDQEATQVQLRLPACQFDSRFTYTIQLESGEVRQQEINRLADTQQQELAGETYLSQTFSLPSGLPWGYHQLTLKGRETQYESLIISAPRRAYTGEQEAASQGWGTFLPLYALRSQENWGTGNYSDLEHLAEWTSRLGGDFVGTLPLLATFLNHPFDPSPYSPVSRQFWNEFYIDVSRIPELQESPNAKQLLESSNVQNEISDLRKGEYVDYRRQMAAKRQILESLAENFFNKKSGRFQEFQQFVRAQPLLEDYARFRATYEKQQRPWQEWPETMRNGNLKPGDYEENAWQYYLYAQWIATQQLKTLAGNATHSGAELYLDLPLGVRPDSFDVWRHQSTFVTDAHAGAPPDAVFTKGQNWGFPPIHPELIREQNYQHVIDYIRHHLEFARLLRIDHVMVLHRLFWIPEGLSPEKGMYVHYHPDELYAILSLESHRHKACIVGENLGTVPTYVNRSMNRHRVRQMYVVQYELKTDPDDLVGRVPRGSLASLNTHDMPTFAAYWRGDDIEDRLELGLLNAASAQEERNNRQELRQALIEWLQKTGRLAADKQPDTQAIMQAFLDFLASSPASAVVVNLEDLWGETRPQNIPATGGKRPNWQRKAQHFFEEFRNMPQVVESLQRLNRLRRQNRNRSSARYRRKEQS